MVDRELNDSVTVTLPVGEVLSASDIEQGTIAMLEQRVLQEAKGAMRRMERVREQIERTIESVEDSEFSGELWTGVVDRLYDTCSTLTRHAVAITTSLAARDALIHQNISRAPESVLESAG